MVAAFPFEPWMALAFLGFGALFAASGATILLPAFRRRQRWDTRPGRVVASRLDDGQFRFQVAFEHDGREIRFWNRYTTSFGVDPAGRDVQVLVDPDDPARAVVSNGQARPEAAGLAFVVVGIVALVIGANLAR